MKSKLNNQGFTLIEVLAVIVILAALMAIMVPSVGSIMNKNKKDNYENLKKSIISSTKMYLSDHRYDIVIDQTKNCQTEGITELNIVRINGKKNEITLTDSKLPIQFLVDEGNLKTDSNNNIHNPMNSYQKLDTANSYIIIKYICKKKGFSYKLEDSYLTWKNN